MASGYPTRLPYFDSRTNKERRKISWKRPPDVPPVKIICRDGEMLRTPEVHAVTKEEQYAAMLRQAAPRSERILAEHMGNLGFKHSVPILKYFADFYHPVLKICIEIDGPQHRAKTARARDRRRNKAFLDQGIRTYRFSCRNVYGDLELVLQNVRDILRLHQIPQENT